MMRKAIHWRLPALAAVLTLAVAGPASAQGVKYLPNDAEIVISVNLKQIWGSKLAKDHNVLIKQLQEQLNAKIKGDNFLAELKESLGLDLFKDIDAVTVGMSELSKDAKTAVIVLEGRFSPNKFNDTFTKLAKDHPEHVKAAPMGNASVFQLTKPGDDPGYIGLLNANTVVISKTKQGMTSAINPPAQNLKKETADLVQQASLKKSVSVVMTGGAIQEAIKQGNAQQAQFITPFLKDLTGAVISANAAADLDLQVNYVTKNADAAKDMADKTNQGLEVVKVLVGNQAKKDANAAALADILKTLKVSAQGNAMIITGNVPQDVVNTALKKLEDFLP
jgi:hypothetical protein